MTVSQIDSVCKLIDNNKQLSEGISEGGFFDQKGGWEIYDLKNKGSDTLFRIRHNISTNLYRKTIFYYWDKELIKAIVKIEDWNNGRTKQDVYSATYYFANKTPIKILDEDPKYSTASTIIVQGQKHQDNFYSKL